MAIEKLKDNDQSETASQQREQIYHCHLHLFRSSRKSYLIKDKFEYYTQASNQTPTFKSQVPLKTTRTQTQTLDVWIMFIDIWTLIQLYFFIKLFFCNQVNIDPKEKHTCT